MKKNLLIILLLFKIYCNAQITKGGIAPNFTVTDINGNQHTLYNYLNAGKSVILEFSSISCGDGWKYDQTEAIQDIYNAYGPPGSNEIMVLYLNDSNWDTVQELNGISNPPTFGNWIQGKTFPMILDPNIFNQYSVNYSPCIYRVCPNKVISNMGQPSASSCYSQLNYGCVTLNGVQNYARLIDTKNGFCDSNGSFKTKIKNYGSNPITSVKLNLKENGEIITSKTFTLNISQFSDTLLEFDPITINANSTYTTELENVNGVLNYNSLFSSTDLPFSLAVNPTSLNLHLKIYTYSCPNNMTWKITNSSETIIASGGPFGIPGSSCNGPMNSIIEQDITLPTEECFNLYLMDYNGLGWKDYFGNAPVPTHAGIEIYSNESLIYSKMNVENFGSKLEFENFMTTKSSNSTETTDDKTTILPNPSNGIITLYCKSKASIKILNLTGQVVFSFENVYNNTSIDISKLMKGVYLVQITNENNVLITQKLILK